MPAADDVVWLEVLPSMKGFGPALAKDAGKIAEQTGRRIGGRYGAAMVAGIASVGGTVAGVGKALYSIGETFDDVIDTIRVGTGATGQDLDGLVETAKRVGTQVPASFDDIGTTVADINTRMGLTGPTLEKVASQFLELGRITGEEVDIGKTSAAFNAFGIEGEAVSGSLDRLYTVSQATGIGVNDLASQVSKAAPAVQALGFSFDDTAALVGNLDKAGLDSNRMMAAMSRSIVNLAKDGESPADAFKRTTGEIQGFLDTGNEAAALELAGKVFGTRGAPQFIAAVKSGALNMEDLASVAGETGDSILGAGKDTMDFAEQWQMFKNKVLVVVEPLASALFATIGEGMDWINANAVPAVEAWVGQWQAGAGSAGEAREKFEGLMGVLRATGAFLWEHKRAVGAVAGAVVGVAGAVAAARGAVAAWNGVMLVWKGIMLASRAVMVGVRLATVAWTVAQRGLNLAMRMNPIGLIITGVMLLVGALIYAWKNSETFRNVVMAVWNGIKAAAMAVIHWFTDKALPGLSAAWAWVSDGAMAMWDGIKAAWELVKSGVSAGLEFLKMLFLNFTGPGLLIKHWDTIVNAVSGAWTKVKDGTSRAVGWVGNKLSTGWEAAKGGTSRAWGAISGAVSTGWSNIKANTQRGVSGARTLASIGWQAMRGDTDGAWSRIKGIVGGAWTAIDARTGGALTRIKAIVLAGFEAVRSYIWSKLEAAKAVVLNAVLAIGARFLMLRLRVEQTVLQLKTKVTQLFQQLRTAAVFIVSWMRDAIVARFTNLRDRGALLIGMLRDWVMARLINLRDRAVALVGFLRDAIVNRFTNLRDRTSALAGMLRDWVMNRFNNLKDRAKATFRSMVDGIRNIWNGLKRVAAAPVKFVIETVFNKGLIKGWNTLVGLMKLGDKLKVKELAVPKFERGGRFGNRVPGSRSRGVDSTLAVSSAGVPVARVDPGEGIVRRASMQKLDRSHPGAFEHINKTGTLPGFFHGGRIPTPGPVRPHGLPYYGARWAGDMGYGMGSPIYAWNDGQVASVKRWGYSYGHHARINHGALGQSLYAHMSKILVSAGQQVKQGDKIGEIGSTGNSTGPHLHFEIRGGNAPIGSGTADAGDGGGLFSMFTGWITDKLTSPVKKLIEKIPGSSVFFDAAKAVANKAKDAVIDKITSFVPKGLLDNGVSGAVAGGNWYDNAKLLMDAGKKLGANRRAMKIALMTAAQESSMGTNRTAMTRINGDGDVGWFQQRSTRGDGTVSQLADPLYGLRVFLFGKTIPSGWHVPGLYNKNWGSMGLGQAAQAVQVSAFPHAYDKWADEAESWLTKYGYAKGTMAARSGLALVGERGPELINFRGGERVWNNDDTSKLLSKPKEEIHLHVSARDGAPVERQIEDGMWHLAHGVDRLVRR